MKHTAVQRHEAEQGRKLQIRQDKIGNVDWAHPRQVSDSTPHKQNVQKINEWRKFGWGLKGVSAGCNLEHTACNDEHSLETSGENRSCRRQRWHRCHVETILACESRKGQRHSGGSTHIHTTMYHGIIVQVACHVRYCTTRGDRRK